jgi:arylsulfatase A
MAAIRTTDFPERVGSSTLTTDGRSVSRFAALGAGLLMAAGAVCLSPSALKAQSDRRPNVILIMADDLGYETIAANGSTSYKTPNIDRLAAGGVRFTRCYVQPLCTPTRMQLMTGKYNVRNYVTFGEMDPHAVTFGNLFKNAGYATCMAGKWQLGRDLDKPKHYGFDEYCLWQHMRRPSRYPNPGLEINGVEKDFHAGQYGPDIVNDYAIDFMTRHKDGPFFLYYPMILTHGPYMATPDSRDWDPKLMQENGDKSHQHFADMVAYMDKLIGKIDATLGTLGIRDNTLLLFFGDNGTGAGTRSMMSAPTGERVVIGGKGQTTEAGMHVPLVASCPGQIAKGKVCDDLVASTDMLPTICAAAGIKLPADFVTDGHSFLPQLKGERGQPREWIYCWYSPRGEALKEMAFDDHYKLYTTGQFYDLTTDVEEQHPQKVGSLSGAAAAAAKKLQAALDEYKDARPSNLPKRTPSEGKAKKGRKAKAA